MPFPFWRSVGPGTIVSFRYRSPTATDPHPMVLLITPEYQGNAHGLNMRYLHPMHSEQLQWIFMNPTQMQQAGPNPFVQQSYAKYQQEKLAEMRKQEQLEQQQGVIVKPQGGTAFGGVSTWGATQKQQEQYQGQPTLGDEEHEDKVEIDREQQRKQREIQELSRKIYQNRQLLQNPYAFYHQYIKPLIGPRSYDIAKVYRKYRNEYVSNVRIVRAVPGTV